MSKAYTTNTVLFSQLILILLQYLVIRGVLNPADPCAYTIHGLFTCALLLVSLLYSFELKRQAGPQPSDDPEVQQIIRHFIKNLPTRLAELDKGLKEKDWEAMITTAHRLKAGALYGLPDIGDAAGKVEDALTNQKYDSIETLLTQLKAKAEKTITKNS